MNEVQQADCVKGAAALHGLVTIPTREVISFAIIKENSFIRSVFKNAEIIGTSNDLKDLAIATTNLGELAANANSTLDELADVFSENYEEGDETEYDSGAHFTMCENVHVFINSIGGSSTLDDCGLLESIVCMGFKLPEFSSITSNDIKTAFYNLEDRISRLDSSCYKSDCNTHISGCYNGIKCSSYLIEIDSEYRSAQTLQSQMDAFSDYVALSQYLGAWSMPVSRDDNIGFSLQ